MRVIVVLLCFQSEVAVLQLCGHAARWAPAHPRCPSPEDTCWRMSRTPSPKHLGRSVVTATVRQFSEKLFKHKSEVHTIVG